MTFASILIFDETPLRDSIMRQVFMRMPLQKSLVLCDKMKHTTRRPQATCWMSVGCSHAKQLLPPLLPQCHCHCHFLSSDCVSQPVGEAASLGLAALIKKKWERNLAQPGRD